MLDDKILKNEEKAVFTLRSLYRKYGYTPYKMSKFEEYDLYVRNKDFLVSDSVITFTDTNGKLMALKPDVTLSIVKNTKDIPGVVSKVCYDENVYRISASTHEFREIMQTGLECIGDLNIYNIYEVIMLAVKSLEAVSDKCILDLSHMGFVSAVLEDIGCQREASIEILTCISEKNLSGLEKIYNDGLIDENSFKKLHTLVSTYGKVQNVLPDLKKICDSDKLLDVYGNFAELCELIIASGLDEKINIDFSIGNDMRYYNGVVFQGFVEGVPVGVLSGGQYDNLMKKMGKKSGAIGFAVYLDSLERLNRVSEKYDVDTVLLYDGASSPSEVASTVKNLTDSGRSVTAQRSVPENIKYRQLLRLGSKGVEILENND